MTQKAIVLQGENRKRVGTKLGTQLGTMHAKIGTIGEKLKNKTPNSE
jgi:hypothetical protein